MLTMTTKQEWCVAFCANSVITLLGFFKKTLMSYNAH